MNIILSQDNLNLHDISVEEFITLLQVADIVSLPSNEELLKSLEKKCLIKIGENDVQLRQDGLEIIERFKVDDVKITNNKSKIIYKKSNRKISKEVEEHVDEYRNVFKGLKPGSMGDPKSCKEKLTRWLDENPEYDIETVIKAAKLYVDSVVNMTYLQRADYFIYRQEANKEEVSRLSSFIDDAKDTKITNVDWTQNHL